MAAPAYEANGEWEDLAPKQRGAGCQAQQVRQQPHHRQPQDHQPQHAGARPDDDDDKSNEECSGCLLLQAKLAHLKASMKKRRPEAEVPPRVCGVKEWRSFVRWRNLKAQKTQKRSPQKRNPPPPPPPQQQQVLQANNPTSQQLQQQVPAQQL